MSLSRFHNILQIVKSRSLTQGVTISERDLQFMSYDVGLLETMDNGVLNVEGHIYNIDGDYITSNYDVDYDYSNTYRDFLFDASTLFASNNLINGSYKVNFVFLKSLLGSPQTLPLFLSEISPDRTEVKLTIKPSYRAKFPEIDNQVDLFKEVATVLKSNDKVNNLVLNFSKNAIQQIVNIKVCCSDSYTLCCKLYSPLSDDIIDKQSCCISFKVLEDYIETFIIKPQQAPPIGNPLRGPDFNQSNICNETGIEYWNNLLDANVDTSNHLVNMILSGSDSISLNVDWTDFENFVVYGSAEERVRNYNYKLQLIEFYASQSSDISNTNASGSTIVTNIATDYTNRIEKVKSNFDQFESYLYYNNGSLFTHDITGSITPTPNEVVSGRFVNSPTTSSAYLTWYNNLLDTATAFDNTNYDSFYYNTPDHILRDPNNSEYITFIHMIGQHFDNIFAYVKELTSIHRRDESPERGIPNELLPHYARSLGWQLKSSQSISNLWLYKLGTDSSGSMTEATGSLPSKSYENLTHQIWRRVVNNLPYLLKTKGTERSVKALFSIYGIPFTLISVKEYGGPTVASDRPTFYEDRYQYALDLLNNQYIEFLRRPGIPEGSEIEQIPQTVEFRFKTNYSSSVSMSLWAMEESNNRTNVLHNLEIVHSGSMYGQGTYGYLKYTATEGFPYSTTPFTATSSLLPLYDNDYWTVKISSAQPIYSGSSFDGTLMIDVGKSSDYTDSRVSISSSFEITGNSYQMLYPLGAVARTYFSSSFTNVDTITFDSFTGGTYGAVVQTRDTDNEVFVPYGIYLAGSVTTADFNNVNLSGIVTSIPGLAYTASLTPSVEYILTHSLDTNSVIAQVSDISNSKILPSEIRIVDENSLGVTISDTADVRISIIGSGSVTYPDTTVTKYPFGTATNVTQSTSEVGGANIVQVFDDAGLALLPESIIIDTDNDEIRVSFGLSSKSGSIHLASGTEISVEDNPHHVLFGGTTGSNSSRFVGSLQSYKEYYGYYDRSVFYEHVLNPGAYYSSDYTSSFDQLFRYYPLGTDNIRYNHSSSANYIISSSHPNQSRTTDTLATFYNFTGSQAEQYNGFSERYYTYRPSLGAHNPKSNKIRIENSELVRPLSPDQKAQVSQYDTAQADSNKLAVVFSPTDQINRDIANQLGPYNFEDYIGDPGDESKTYYPLMEAVRNDYYKKYTTPNDIGKFIEVFSLYDFSIFHQIQQLIPARSNLVTGILIEPTILERSKIGRKQPTISKPSYNTTLENVTDDPTSTYIKTHQAVLNAPITLEIERSKHTASLSTPIILEAERTKYSAEIDSLDYQGLSSTIQPMNVEIALRGDEQTITSTAHSLVVTPTTASFSYKRNGVSYTTTIYDNKLSNLQAEITEGDYYKTYNQDWVAGQFVCKNSGGTEVPFITDYVGNLNYSFELNTVQPSITGSYSIDGESFEQFLNLYDYEVVNNNNNIYIKRNRGSLYSNYVTGSKTTDTYSKITYHYSSSGVYSSTYDREKQSATNKLIKNYYSSSLENWNYQFVEDSALMNCRFKGSKLTGGGINIDSINTISGGPVVRVTIVNDNAIIV